MNDNWQYGAPEPDPYGDPNAAHSGGYPNPSHSGGYPNPAQSGGYPPAHSEGYPDPSHSGGYSSPYPAPPAYPASPAYSGAYPAPPMHPGNPYYVEPPSKGSAIGALVTSIILVVTCCGFLAAVGLVYAALALNEAQDHEKAARFTRNAWIANSVVIALMLAFGAFGITMMVIA